MRRRSHSEHLDPRLATAAQALYVDAFTAEVVRALAEAGTSSTIVRGPVVAKHLHPEGVRGYSDAGLLVAPRLFADGQRAVAKGDRAGAEQEGES